MGSRPDFRAGILPNGSDVVRLNRQRSIPSILGRMPVELDHLVYADVAILGDRELRPHGKGGVVFETMLGAIRFAGSPRVGTSRAGRRRLAWQAGPVILERH